MQRYGIVTLGLAGLVACTGSSTQPISLKGSGGASPSLTGGTSTGGGATGGSVIPTGGTLRTGGQARTGGTASAGGGPTSGGTPVTGGVTIAGGAPGTGGIPSVDAGPADTAQGSLDTGTVDGARDSPSVETNKADAPADAPAGDTATLSPPSQDTILAALRRANTYFMGLHPDPTVDIVTDKSRPSNLWTRAIYYEGLMGLYAVEPDATRKASYYDYAVKWGESPSHAWTLTYTAAGTMTDNADNMACGQTYLDLYAIDPKPERIAVLKKNVDDMVAKKTNDAWTWIDALQMAMPIFARFGVLQSDPAYFDAMWALYSWTRDTRGGGLLNKADGLWWRDWHFTPGGGTQQKLTPALHESMPSSGSDANLLSPNGKNVYWSRGNGWIMAALVRVLEVLPTSDPHYATYLADFKALAAALPPLQRPDGFWSSSLVDPTHCATLGLPGQDGPETSGTALFAYGLAWGIRKKILETTYRAPLLAAWSGLTSIALQANGLLGYVQSTGDRPCTDTTALAATKLANFDDYGAGAFLLAGSELYRLAAP